MDTNLSRPQCVKIDERDVYATDKKRQYREKLCGYPLMHLLVWSICY